MARDFKQGGRRLVSDLMEVILVCEKQVEHVGNFSFAQVQDSFHASLQGGVSDL